MAKDTKKAAEQQEKEVDLVQQIENGTKFDEALAKKADEELKEEQDKEKIRQIKDVRCQASYTKNRELLTLRKYRDIDPIIKEAVKALGELEEKVTKGEITPMAYEEEVNKVGNEKNKKIAEINKKYDRLRRQLRQNYPSYHVSEWEYENWSCGSDNCYRSGRYNW